MLLVLVDSNTASCPDTVQIRSFEVPVLKNQIEDDPIWLDFILISFSMEGLVEKQPVGSIPNSNIGCFDNNDE